MIDLHLHSTASDGTFSPTELVALGKEKGAHTLALCDHDTTSGVEEAVMAGKEMGLRVIPAVEISCGTDVTVHLLGYFVDANNPSLQEVLSFLSNTRDMRMYKMLTKLQQAGINITPKDVLEFVDADGVTGRPHIAKAMIAKGYVPDVATAFSRYIGQNAPCYVEREKLSTQDAIAAILDAGGLPVLAHGGLLRLEDAPLNCLLDRMQKEGLRGLECYHSSHTKRMQQQFRMLAKQRSLLVTGGSDFHGLTKPTVFMHSGLENWADEEECLSALLQAGLKA